MTLPLTVDMTVAVTDQQFNMVAETDEPVDLEVSTAIVANTSEEYEGPYSVTPTEEAQTLDTDGMVMTDDVTIGAIPSDYVGSSVPRKSSSDLTASGPTVSVPAGYYEESAAKSIDNASLNSPLEVVANPSIYLDDNGHISADVSSNTFQYPFRTDGYARTFYSVQLKVNGSNGYDLDTQAAATITPTESQQTAVGAFKWTTGDVKVAAIPSDYVGSAVTQRSSSDLTASGATVSAPAGYYAEAASKAIGNATLQTLNVTANPTLDVDNAGLVTATLNASTLKQPISANGYAKTTDAVQVKTTGSGTLQLNTLAAQTITPSNVAQTIQAGQYLTGDQTISAIAPPYYDMSGALAWMGVGAELISTINLADVKLSATDFASWTPSTTAQDILATRTAGTFSATGMDVNDYVICWETVIPIVYSSGYVDKARPLYLSAFHAQMIIRRASSMANILALNANSNINASAFTGGNFLRYYGSTQGTITYTWSTSYGFYGTVTANTLSSTTSNAPTVTLKTPKVTARCSTTYMSTGNAALIDQDKTIIKQSCKVYRIKKSGFYEGCFNHLMSMVQGMENA